MMATVTKRTRTLKNGEKTHDIFYKDPETSKKTFYKTFRKEDVALLEMDKLRTFIDTGRWDFVRDAKKKTRTKSRPMTFKQAADLCEQDWLLGKRKIKNKKQRKKKLSPKTVEGYLVQLKMLNRQFGSRYIFDITADDIERYLDDVEDETSVFNSNRRLHVLKQVFARAVAEQALVNNPCEDIPFIDESDHQRKTFLMPDQINKVLKACDVTRGSQYMKAAFLLAVEHGASKQEILDLTWDDIDFDNNMIRFHRTKNGVCRTQPMMPRTRQAIEDWKAHQAWSRRRKKAQLGKVENQQVFSKINGETRKSFGKLWGKICEAAGIKGYRFHDNRHTFCSNIRRLGGDCFDIRDLVGHKDLESTKRYSHLASERGKQLLEGLASDYGR